MRIVWMTAAYVLTLEGVPFAELHRPFPRAPVIPLPQASRSTKVPCLPGDERSTVKNVVDPPALMSKQLIAVPPGYPFANTTSTGT